MRKSDLMLSALGLGIVLVLLSLVDAGIREQSAADHLARVTHLVRDLELTDLSLFTEARYTRHLTQSDYHAAFQDHPFAIEHFPTGSLVMPPLTLSRVDESLSSETAISD